MKWLDLDPSSIKHILITHQDTDHVGAVERDSDGLLRDATLYIGEVENRYLTKQVRRKVYGGWYRLPNVEIDNKKVLLQDGQVLDLEGIQIECILVPGHSWGHMVYLIDDDGLDFLAHFNHSLFITIWAQTLSERHGETVGGASS